VICDELNWLHVESRETLRLVTVSMSGCVVWEAESDCFMIYIRNESSVNCPVVDGSLKVRWHKQNVILHKLKHVFV